MHSVLTGIARYAEYMDTFLGMAIRIVTLIGLLAGISYVHSLRQKREEAVFGFWSKLKIRLKNIDDALRQENGLIDNMYPEERRLQSESASPGTSAVEEFKTIVGETEAFLRDAEDQMPAYRGWTEDLDVFLAFVSDTKAYEITDPQDGFVSDSFPDRDEYCAKVCKALDRMTGKIDARQKETEKKLCRRERDG